MADSLKLTTNTLNGNLYKYATLKDDLKGENIGL